ncbi:MAG: hypothetical protein J6B68_02965, partial [Lachnospiraceae bacterium]|nr:hypothetical protein [Lachnospiraceae bacterium]
IMSESAPFFYTSIIPKKSLKVRIFTELLALFKEKSRAKTRDFVYSLRRTVIFIITARLLPQLFN